MIDESATVESAPAVAPGANRVPVGLDPHERFLRNKNFASLDGVRCLCCLGVIKEHVGWVFPSPSLITMGFLGVDLFFVISGFLIVTLLIRERERRGDVSLGKFYARRSLRIFPIYYLLIFGVFALYLAISPWKPDGLGYYLAGLPVLLTYTQDLVLVPLGNFNACWTLAMEEQFYLLWPTVEKFAARPVRWAVLLGMLALNQAVSFGAFDGPIARVYGDEAATKQPIFAITFTPILLGVMLAYLLDDRRSFRVLYRLIGHRWSPFLFLALAFAICERNMDLGGAWTRSLLHPTFMLLLGSLVIREDHFARPILTLPPLARLGVISYGIYLYHLWVSNIVHVAIGRAIPGGVGKGLLFVLVTLATVAAAEASFRLVERPLLRWKERFHS